MHSQPLDRVARGRFDGRREFQQILREVLAAAAVDREAKRLCLCDPDFEDWPLGEMEVVESLSQWVQSHPGGQCVLVAATFDQVASWHPRWVAWRQTWSHRVTCLQCPDEERQRLPSLLLVPDVLVVQRLETVHSRGRVARDAADLVAARERFDAILQRSTETYPATTLGL